MAAEKLPWPGETAIIGGIEEQIGPCAEKCEHVDCAATRRMASAKCRHCKKRIGYGRLCYKLDELGDLMVHASCHESALKARGNGVSA